MSDKPNEKNPINLHKENAMGKLQGKFKPGRPAAYAKGGVVEGVRQRYAIGTGGSLPGKGRPVAINAKGTFQKRK